MDARTEHLIGLVKEGSSLEEAGRVYGIGRERVRQLLKAEGISIRELPGRAEKRRDNRSAPSNQAGPVVKAMWREIPLPLGPVIEVMWREGVLYHEIADVFHVTCGEVHRLIRERVPPAERSAQTAARVGDDRSPAQRQIDGMRRAAGVLKEGRARDADEGPSARGVIDRWLAAHSELSETPDPRSSSEAAASAETPTSPSEPMNQAALRGELDRFKAELRAGGLKESTIHSYLMGSSLFVRWLAGDYVPGRADCRM